MTIRPVRVLLLSESRLLRETFADAVKDELDLLIVGACSQSDEAFALIAHSRCDVLLVDSDLSQWDLPTSYSLRSLFPSMKIILFNSDRVQPRHDELALGGVAACLQKESSIEHTTATLRAVADGETFHPRC